MTRNTFTLTLGSATDLTITLRPPIEQFDRSIMQETQVKIEEYTPNGTALKKGISPAVGTRYQWNALVEVSLEEALIIEGIWAEQDDDIVLKDEYRYLPARITPIKTFVAGSTETVTVGAVTLTTGYFQGNVRLEFPDKHKSPIGISGGTWSLQNAKAEIEFVLKEL